jgi:hypothetical protein
MGSHIALCLPDRILPKVKDRRCKDCVGVPQYDAVDKMLEPADASRSDQRDSDCVAESPVKIVIEALLGPISIH